jgi:predicted nucleic acid-binding protein
VGYLIDSSVLIAAERGQVDVASRTKGREDEPFFVSVVSASELLHGVWRAEEPGRRAKRQAFVEDILRKLPILPVDLSVARTHAHIWADLQARGKLIGCHDLWLAATSFTHGLTLVTRNLREFERVPGLSVERW